MLLRNSLIDQYFILEESLILKVAHCLKHIDSFKQNLIIQRIINHQFIL